MIDLVLIAYIFFTLFCIFLACYLKGLRDKHSISLFIEMFKWKFFFDRMMKKEDKKTDRKKKQLKDKKESIQRNNL